jgi:hypothetical protein
MLPGRKVLQLDQSVDPSDIIGGVMPRALSFLTTRTGSPIPSRSPCGATDRRRRGSLPIDEQPYLGVSKAQRGPGAVASR